MKRKLTFVVLILVFLAGVTLVCNWTITRETKSYLYTDVQAIPHHRVGLVLGTSEKLASGQANPYFSYRIQAAYSLFKNKKVDYLLVSGDNSSKNYNEPRDMKDALVKLGVPENRIYLDYAGFRTLDSVVRAKEIFGQESFTVISQPFHNQRAVFLARHKGVDAVAYNARDIKGANGYKTHTREWLARVKVFIDLYLNKEPHFLGERVKIG
ncbi:MULTISPECIES: SanA/YdcF family protein [Xanthocytophaga]|uniref:ElyC/SanA/YdcF family protein n=2 Tax=Xanthocytophaga TaxID=3078918 RepID=A0AAE3UAQ1_9BACT|nr:MULTISPECIES: ElyC/SanA/YdcF family protein [Xanthocytophaga]MDJ1473432.1 ElyC/SanA/YdcF family protein [Xanthocytophaga flavus]MDJ1483573.1 ElyC/SanA/YdcF family protein [Xanthocytophaga flavus]MDJ1505433.1 ElyC/SanA/YdcF family protein [Xanthocytophaga agilis]